MMTEVRMIIGVENHVRLNTSQKLFCACRNEVETCPVCLGFPGTMPQLNFEAVQLTYRLAKVLNFSIAKLQMFDRKVYKYRDLPKMYQITQQYQPFGTSGFAVLGSMKVVDIARISLEEDAASTSITAEGKFLVDFRRSGSPLAEITTSPMFSSANEVCEYLTFVRNTCQALSIIDAGNSSSLRCDVNISLVVDGVAHPRTEVKNVNSLGDIRKAICFEYERQLLEITSGRTLTTTTRGFRDGKTYHMREKEVYCFLPEHDIPPFEFNGDNHCAVNLPQINSWFAGLNQEEVQKLQRVYALGRIGLLQDCVSRGLRLGTLLNLLDNDYHISLTHLLMLYNKVSSGELNMKQANQVMSSVSAMLSSYQHENLNITVMPDSEMLEEIVKIPKDTLSVPTVVQVLREKFKQYSLNFDKIRKLVEMIKNDSFEEK